MTLGIHPQPSHSAPQVFDHGCIGAVFATLIETIKKIWALALNFIKGAFHFATCGYYASSILPVTMPPVPDPMQSPRRPERLLPPVVLEEAALVSMESRIQFSIGGLPPDTIRRIFSECVSKGDIKGLMTLGLTNIHSYVTMRKLVKEVALTQLCPNLRILNARTYKFQADLISIDKYKTLVRYYKLEPFVEGSAGLTIIFNHRGLTLKNMKENNCGVIVNTNRRRISEELDDVPEEDRGPEMISNAPITGTRGKRDEVQEKCVRDEVGFDGKPTLIGSVALMIATQKEVGIHLYGEYTYGRTATDIIGDPVVVGFSAPGSLYVSIIPWHAEHGGVGIGGSCRLSCETKVD